MEEANKRGKPGAQVENKSKPKYEYTTIDYVILVAVIFVCLWSWIFVDSDTLRRSPVAQGIVNAVAWALPWIGVLERYGPQAHKLMLVHSVCYLVLTPLMGIYVRKLFKKRIGSDAYRSLVGLLLFVLLLFLMLAPYYSLQETFAGTAGRHGYGLLLQPWSMPLMACLSVGGVLFLLYVSFGILIDLVSCFGRKDG